MMDHGYTEILPSIYKVYLILWCSFCKDIILDQLKDERVFVSLSATLTDKAISSITTVAFFYTS